MKPTSPLPRRSSEKAAALIIVLAFVVILTGLAVAYLSRATTDRQLAHSSFHDTDADLLARSALDIVVGDFRLEIVNGSQKSGTIYIPTNATNMVPQQSGNVAGVPNLIRRSVSPDTIPLPGVASRASAVSSAPSPSPAATPKRGDVTCARWNSHYLSPKANTGDDTTDPVASFTAPDWVIVTRAGPSPFPVWNSRLKDPTSTNPFYAVGRYAYAVYDEGGLLDINVAGYPTCGSTGYPPADSNWVQPGRKGSLAFADLSALSTDDKYRLGNPDTSGVYQIDRLVGWRNYATTQPDNVFPGPTPPAFAANFHADPTPAKNFYNYVINDTTGFLAVPTTTCTPPPSEQPRTGQAFLNRQNLIAFRNTVGNISSFSTNVLQYLSTFSREINAPSFSPATPNPPVNPNFLLIRVTGNFTRFDHTPAVVGEPLVKTRFPLSRLTWITYKGPSQPLVGHDLDPNIVTPATSDPIITNLVTNFGVSVATLEAGTAANIKTVLWFGLGLTNVCSCYRNNKQSRPTMGLCFADLFSDINPSRWEL